MTHFTYVGVRGRVTLPYHVYRVMRGKARKQSVSQRSKSPSFSTPGPAPAHTPTSQTAGTAHPPITIDAPPTTSEAARAGLLAAPGADIKPRSASEGAAVVSVGGGSNAHVHDHLAVPRPATGAQGSFATISDTSEAEQLFHGELNFEDRIHMCVNGLLCLCYFQSCYFKSFYKLLIIQDTIFHSIFTLFLYCK